MTPPPSCTKCSALLPVEYLNLDRLLPCPGCNAPIRAEVFPAFFKELGEGRAGEALLIGTEASCFYHEQKKAEAVCGACGRYLCALCDVDLDGAHYCPSCLEAAQKKGALATIENERKLYDRMAFHVAILSVCVPVFGAAIAPVAIFMAIRFRKAPTSLVRRTGQLRFILTLLLAGGSFLGWGFLFISQLLK